MGLSPKMGGREWERVFWTGAAPHILLFASENFGAGWHYSYRIVNPPSGKVGHPRSECSSGLSDSDGVGMAEGFP